MTKPLDDFIPTFKKLYGDRDEQVARQVERYSRLVGRFEDRFAGRRENHLFSTPGRIEIGGNHTDHNHGRVLAAAINLDAIAVAAANDTDQVTLFSEGYPNPFEIDLQRLDVLEEEKGTTAALIRGIAHGLQGHSHHIGGFSACIQSDVLEGSGLSSSAAIEILIATIFNALFNGNRVGTGEIAGLCQSAENVYFGKPCGLMDQMTSATGGIVNIDFEHPEAPLVRKVDVDIRRDDYRVVILNTGGSHADLTEDYASIPEEMKAVANALGETVCRNISMGTVMAEMSRLRELTGDRAVLRAMHFLAEDERVDRQVRSLAAGDMKTFLALIRESGNSSYKWLQNIYSTRDAREQAIAIALSLTEQYISQIDAGACRVHGGGFAGTILVFLPDQSIGDYVALMEPVFGRDSVKPLTIRPYGSVHLDTFMS